MTLEDLGLNAKLLVAGFAGGVVHALVFKQAEPAAVVGSVITGTLTANFLAPVVSHYTGGWIDGGGCAFIVGLTAMVICQGLVSIVTSRMKDTGERTKPTTEERP